MHLEIVFDNEVMPVDLRDGQVKVGGGPKDDIRLGGLPHGLLTLTLENGQVQVQSIRSLRIGKALFPANVPRLVVPGEELRLPNDVVLRQPVDQQRRESRKLAATAFVAKELLSGDVSPEDTRAATFTCVTGYDKGLTFPITADDCTIGRAEDSHVKVRDRAVSRLHARLLRRGKRFFLRPSSDMNGTFLNGSRLKAEAPIQSGDVLELGQTMLRFNGPERAPEEQTAVVSPGPAKQEAKPPPPPAEEAAAPAEIAVEPIPVPVADEPAAALDAAPEASSTQPLPRRRVPSELLFMGVGALLAASGLAVTLGLYFLTR
ncbi:MAG: FHA domain-containing protein [Myxococcales bacterium]|nr:FHA domain-containing protein [Myxococcales bacterium]